MPGTNKLIFIVDDDKILLNLLEYVFQGKDGYTVKTFLSGEDCLGNMHLKPCLVILDYVLNEKDSIEMDGLETLQQLIKINKSLPVIILSGYTDDKTSQIMIKSGAKKVLRKDNFFVDTLEKYLAAELE